MKRALQTTEPNKDEREIYVKKLRINNIKPGTILEIIPMELLVLIGSFCEIIEKHVLRFVCKKFYQIAHKSGSKQNKEDFFFVNKNQDSNRDMRSETYIEKISFARDNVICLPGTIPKKRDADSFSRRKISIFTIVIKRGYLDILKWMSKCFSTVFEEHEQDYCWLAALYGHLELLKWARESGYFWGMKTCSAAARNGHLEVLKWARNNKCPWDSRTVDEAAKGGHLEILKWVKENDDGYTMSSGHPGFDWMTSKIRSDHLWMDICSSAAEGGHLEVLKWARENGCLWDEDTCDSAALNGHLEVLKWARKNGCPWDSRTCHSAALNGHLEVL
jgi:hypothetical protein